MNTESESITRAFHLRLKGGFDQMFEFSIYVIYFETKSPLHLFTRPLYMFSGYMSPSFDMAFKMSTLSFDMRFGNE